ncbi:isocitrate lyase/phosphoenolpyruvate mutase family protein [Pseudolysobacter antarcticus]|uniref:Isocitrate lyase/phosphoenolpyruvate mutase family protein n=1 Tax=Pseudolysobacter antarcticus TaxID=2511995 RepID=A0A411HEW1_9GAMM|nr:isocitrate lyase/phosphoenolpyruvate mutase family protein [Pseudolysobacter antarcticus]QBB69022.1 isocitrate lyase/phosphoenolpyruvate mutase family protein [Pseudolysobacter antarcticus]
MRQKELAESLAALHVKGSPLVLYNAWDAGSAKAIRQAGSPAIATSSWAVAAAQGYDDGESMPFAFVEQVVARIIGAVDAPVTVDIEAGYSDDPQVCAGNVARLMDYGAVGINFEDRIVRGGGLHGVDAQCARIAAIRAMADARGVRLFINARTDMFLGSGVKPPEGMTETKARAAAYARAGASGFFVPGLVDLSAIRELCNTTDLPLNVMTMPGLPHARELADAGVARISYGPAAYLLAMEAIRNAARDIREARQAA